MFLRMTLKPVATSRSQQSGACLQAGTVCVCVCVCAGLFCRILVLLCASVFVALDSVCRACCRVFVLAHNVKSLSALECFGQSSNFVMLEHTHKRYHTCRHTPPFTHTTTNRLGCAVLEWPRG